MPKSTEAFAPRSAQKREYRVNARVTGEEKDWIDELVETSECSVSDVIREALRTYKRVLDGEQHV